MFLAFTTPCVYSEKVCLKFGRLMMSPIFLRSSSTLLLGQKTDCVTHTPGRSHVSSNRTPLIVSLNSGTAKISHGIPSPEVSRYCVPIQMIESNNVSRWSSEAFISLHTHTNALIQVVGETEPSTSTLLRWTGNNNPILSSLRVHLSLRYCTKSLVRAAGCWISAPGQITGPQTYLSGPWPNRRLQNNYKL